MAIGSAPEAGTEFINIRPEYDWGIDGLKGYAVLVYPPRYPNGNHPGNLTLEEY